jgi:ADP-ribose pyrophosphatase YjhB (NUDIX family)
VALFAWPSSGADGGSRLSELCPAGGRQLIAGCLLRVGERILLSRRAAPPRVGCWTIPGGFVEPGETAQQAALRELEEEAGVRVSGARLTAVYEMPQIAQILLLFSACLGSCAPHAGSESCEVGLFDPRRVPWDELAFATDRRTVLRCQHDATRETVELGWLHWAGDGRICLTGRVAESTLDDAMYS